jgi:hypothetical protein
MRVKSTGKRRQRGFCSRLNDAEVIVMEIVGEYQGIDTDAGILRYFGQHWRHLFPNLTTRCNFSRQAANLGQVKTLSPWRKSRSSRSKRFRHEGPVPEAL